MRRILVCTALILFAPNGARATTEIDSTPLEVAPTETTFAYRARHGATALSAPTLNALWFSGEDRELPRMPVAEPIVVVPANAVRLQPSRNELCSQAAIVAAEHDLPVPFFANLIQQESGFKSHVVSPAGAQGIAQFMPRVARAYGLENPFDPVHALSVSAKFLRELLGQFGNLGLAAAAYNAGPSRVQNWMAKRGKLPEETRNYVRNITGHPAERWARVDAKTEGTRLPGHARCPGMPEVQVSIPEAAPVKVAKAGKKGSKVQVAEAKSNTAKASDAKASDAKASDTKSGDAKPKDAKETESKAAETKLPSVTSYAVASVAPAKRVTVTIEPRGGKMTVVAQKTASATKPVAKKVAAKEPAKAAAKPAATAAAKSNVKTAAKTPANPAANKPATKTAAKSQTKPPPGKKVKVAAAR